jgi:hypothetical protein
MANRVIEIFDAYEDRIQQLDCFGNDSEKNGEKFAELLYENCSATFLKALKAKLTEMAK